MCRALCAVKNHFSGRTATQRRKLRNLSLCRSNAFYRQNHLSLSHAHSHSHSLWNPGFPRHQDLLIDLTKAQCDYGWFLWWPGVLNSHLELQQFILTSWGLEWLFRMLGGLLCVCGKLLDVQLYEVISIFSFSQGYSPGGYSHWENIRVKIDLAVISPAHSVI